MKYSLQDLPTDAALKSLYHVAGYTTAVKGLLMPRLAVISWWRLEGAVDGHGETEIQANGLHAREQVSFTETQKMQLHYSDDALPTVLRGD